MENTNTNHQNAYSTIHDRRIYNRRESNANRLKDERHEHSLKFSVLRTIIIVLYIIASAVIHDISHEPTRSRPVAVIAVLIRIGRREIIDRG